VFFLDDHLFGDPRFASDLFDGMRGMGRLWQAAGTVTSVLRGKLLSKAASCGLRSLFIGFETLNQENLRGVGKVANINGDYSLAIRRLRDLGIMVNASFVFGMDGDDTSVFDRTVDWAVSHGIETATFHILTPYPGTALYRRLSRQGRITTRNWDLYDTRHAVFQPAGMTAAALEAGYWRAYHKFYRWSNILRAARTKAPGIERLRHVFYTGGWKKLEGLWNLTIKLGVLPKMLPLLESILAGFGRYPAARMRRSGHASPAKAGIDHLRGPRGADTPVMKAKGAIVLPAFSEGRQDRGVPFRRSPAAVSRGSRRWHLRAPQTRSSARTARRG